jgi:hypothetical protein
MRIVTILGYIILIISGISLFICAFWAIWGNSPELMLKFSITFLICSVIGFILSQLEELLSS